MRAAPIFVLFAGLTLASQAQAFSTIDAKFHGAMTAAKKQSDKVGATKRSLKGLVKNKKIMKALEATGDHIELASIPYAHAKMVTIFEKTNWLGDGPVARMPVLVKGEQKLVVTSKGLEIRNYESYATPKAHIVKAMQDNLDAQLKSKPTMLHLPDMKIEHDEYGPTHFVEQTKVRVGGFGLFSSKVKLDVASWTKHIDADSIAKSVETWAKK